MKLHIKYMVSIRCKMVVKAELKKLGLSHSAIELGEVEVNESISSQQLNQFKVALKRYGLELMDDKKSMLIEKIKNVVIEMVHYSDEKIKTSFSDHLAEKLDYDYTYMANLFSEVHGTTIENFIIINKIERVKELLIYNELNLTEIAFKLHYSSVSHLSNQFKKVTGLTPSYFKQLRHKRRNPLEDL